MESGIRAESIPVVYQLRRTVLRSWALPKSLHGLVRIFHVICPHSNCVSVVNMDSQNRKCAALITNHILCRIGNEYEMCSVCVVTYQHDLRCSEMEANCYLMLVFPPFLKCSVLTHYHSSLATQNLKGSKRQTFIPAIKTFDRSPRKKLLQSLLCHWMIQHESNFTALCTKLCFHLTNYV